MAKTLTVRQKKAVEECFRLGTLSWMLKPEQKEIYDLILATEANQFVLNCSRRLGKSYLMCIIAEEFCRQVPGALVKYAAPSKKQVREIIRPIFNKLLFRCPHHLKPWWNTLDSCFFYPNGSKISIVGCDKGNIDSLRGESMDLGLIDEAGMIDEDLNYVVKDVLKPQTLTVERIHPLSAKIIMGSTPPRTPAHPFVQYIAEAEASNLNNYAHRTIYDNSMIDEKTILEYAKDSGCTVRGGKITRYSTTFRREYLAEVVTEETSSIIPEFTSEKQQEIVKEWPRPAYFDAYVSMDVGLIDLTFIIFGYYDFLKAKLIIEDEIVMNYRDGLNTKLIADAIKEKEKELWNGAEPYLRVMDNDPILCQDLNLLHGLNFVPTDKDDKEAAVNNVRLMVHSGDIIIHPRCKNLIAHMKYGVWDKTRRKFERSGEFGHFDGVDAVVYKARNINKYRNPYPPEYIGSDNNFVNPEMNKKLNGSEQGIRDAILVNI